MGISRYPNEISVLNYIEILKRISKLKRKDSTALGHVFEQSGIKKSIGLGIYGRLLEDVESFEEEGLKDIVSEFSNLYDKGVNSFVLVDGNDEIYRKMKVQYCNFNSRHECIQMDRHDFPVFVPDFSQNGVDTLSKGIMRDFISNYTDFGNKTSNKRTLFSHTFRFSGDMIPSKTVMDTIDREKKYVDDFLSIISRIPSELLSVYFCNPNQKFISGPMNSYDGEYSTIRTNGVIEGDSGVLDPINQEHYLRTTSMEVSAADYTIIARVNKTLNGTELKKVDLLVDEAWLLMTMQKLTDRKDINKQDFEKIIECFRKGSYIKEERVSKGCIVPVNRTLAKALRASDK